MWSPYCRYFLYFYIFSLMKSTCSPLSEVILFEAKRVARIGLRERSIFYKESNHIPLIKNINLQILLICKPNFLPLIELKNAM